MINQDISRRQFLSATALSLAGIALSSQSTFGMPAILKNMGKPNSKFNGVQIGVITYSFRDMPEQSAEATLQYIVDCGISATELMGGPAESFAGAPKNPVNMQAISPLRRKRSQKQALTAEEEKQLAEADAQLKAYRQEVSKWRLSAPMNKFEQLRKMYNQAGVQIYGFKPDVFGLQSPDAQIDYGLRVAKLLGATHVTLEHPGDDAHTLKLSTMAQKRGLKVAYHGHEQQTPTFWDTALSQSPANALNLDVGHYTAAGYNALDIVQAKHDRIASAHLKDRQNAANGKGNLPWGTGDTPIAELLQVMKKNKYTFPATVELEYQIPEGSSAVKEVAKCVEYCRKALEKNT